MPENNFISLSHWVNENTPTYNNNGFFKRQSVTKISDGRTSNSESWEFNNHIGTHIDYPYHFYSNGKTSSDLPKFLIYNNISIIIYQKEVLPNQIIKADDLFESISNLDKTLEVLILKTGFQKYRNTEIYWKNNPGYDENLYDLFKSKLPNLKIFGIDTISLTSVNSKEIGAKAHRKFLNNDDEILIIEDLDLEAVNFTMIPNKLIIAPLLISNTDGTPVNCILQHSISNKYNSYNFIPNVI
jgi:arylformamidase